MNPGGEQQLCEDWSRAALGLCHLQVPGCASFLMQLFQKLTLKIQGQGHGWGQNSEWQCESNILSTHIPFAPCQSPSHSWDNSMFKIWPCKSKVKVIAQGHKIGLTPYRLISLSFHVDRPSHSWDTAISKFDVENSRLRSLVRSKLSHNMGPTFSRLTSLSFHVNQAFHSWVTTFSKFDLENQGSRSCVRSHFKVTMWV